MYFDVQEKPLLIGIEGLILCQSGPKTFPIKGAVPRITCLAVDEHGYETPPFSILCKATDSKVITLQLWSIMNSIITSLSLLNARHSLKNLHWRLVKFQSMLTKE
ncbi:hypothetical protein REPUB_Repub12eG0038300 [Reevesia pubescens]